MGVCHEIDQRADLAIIGFVHDLLLGDAKLARDN
jgi:hypothetical protein